MDFIGLDAIKNNKKINEYYICCPFCVRENKTPDTGYHLGVNISSGVYHCYRCNSAGRVRDVSELGLMSNAVLDDFSAIKNKILSLYTNVEISFDLNEFSWPVDKDDTPFAYKYLTEVRKYSDEDIKKYNIRVGKSYFDPKLNREVNKWTGRVIFPYFYEGKCIYMVGRSYNNKSPKYLNCIGPKALVLYQSGEIGDSCIVCEGVISAHSAYKYSGVASVALLGKTALGTQLEMLRSKCSKVYKCLDGDVEDRVNRNLVNQLLKSGFEVYNIDLPEGKDPDDLKEDFMEYFNKAKRVSYL